MLVAGTGDGVGEMGGQTGVLAGGTLNGVGGVRNGEVVRRTPDCG